MTEEPATDEEAAAEAPAQEPDMFAPKKDAPEPTPVGISLAGELTQE